MQTRSLSGTQFEKELCEKMGYKSNAKKPKINWTGIGNNLLKIRNTNFDASLFRPTDLSTYDKWDVLTQSGSKREVKKYNILDVSDWHLYSEPIVKVCTRKDLNIIERYYGEGDLELGRQKYNSFINELFTQLEKEGVLTDILTNITSKSEGIEFKDGFIEKSKIEFRWSVKKSFWQGFDRIMLEFKIVS